MIPDNLRYHKEHEWVRVEGKQAVIGISDHAQEALGDIVFFQLPQVGAKVKAGQEIGEVESTKATSSIYTPISGTVSKVNVALNEKPELANKDPYGEGWVAVIEMANPAEVNGLMDAKAYAAYLDKEAENGGQATFPEKRGRGQRLGRTQRRLPAPCMPHADVIR